MDMNIMDGGEGGYACMDGTGISSLSTLCSEYIYLLYAQLAISKLIQKKHKQTTHADFKLTLPVQADTNTHCSNLFT